ncbi:MAG TPA: YggS family pyridoxal phosphate-dependent enzyme [Candidatus Bathyarchaeia archaeon]|nr:YggS family pyridoxal phosphate-dependent enzyme [Candidatus Bathyarchaeia archaeon]
MTPDIRANLEAVRERIARACARAGRKPADVLLIAVSKTVEIERIRGAVAAGVQALGENRVQEAKEKVAALGRPVPWHLIGSLQTNKSRDAVELFDWIHSVDREELARELDRRAHQRERTVKALVQVNVGEEPQKGGVAPAELKGLLDAMTSLRHLDVRGLMCIPPATETADAARPWFKRLRDLRDAAGLEHCSMGMSGDFEVAIEEGATMVRVGTAIFGPRAPRAAVTEGGA